MTDMSEGVLSNSNKTHEYRGASAGVGLSEAEQPDTTETLGGNCASAASEHH